MIRERADWRTTTSLDRAEWLNAAGYNRNGLFCVNYDWKAREE
jgi:hypothetical protein